MNLRRKLLIYPLGLTVVSPYSFAQPGWPNKPIKIVVPATAGGVTDIIARVIVDKLKSYISSPIVIENKGGAGTQIGTEFVARAEPDGYTFLLGVTQAFTILPNIRKLSYTIENFDPVAGVAEYAAMVILKKELGVNNLGEFITLAKNNPGKLTWGTAGIGSSGHINGEQLKKHANIDLLHVPYKASAESVTALVSGEVDMIIDPTGLNLVTSNKATGVACFSSHRHPLLPHIPAITEFKDLKVELPVNGWCLLAPKGTNKHIVETMNNYIQQILNDPVVREKMIGVSAFPRYFSAQELIKTVNISKEHHKEILEKINIKP